MTKHQNSPTRTGKQPRTRSAKPPTFTPTPRARERHDGWTADRQLAFIEALAECACVDEACAKVGVSRSAAYAFRTRAEARSFRVAWEAALDAGTRRLAEAVFSRALHGVTRPVFYKSEQIGDRRYHDERLAMFLPRYRDPYRYRAWNDRERFVEASSDEPFTRLTLAMNHLAEDTSHDELGIPAPSAAHRLAARAGSRERTSCALPRRWRPGTPTLPTAATAAYRRPARTRNARSSAVCANSGRRGTRRTGRGPSVQLVHVERGAIPVAIPAAGCSVPLPTAE